jgi:hypothetical protein
MRSTLRTLAGYALILGLVLSLAGALPPLRPAQAQDDDQLMQRVDEAMAHLSNFLGGRGVSRRSHVWQWEAATYEDRHLGCVTQGETFAQPQPGYRIRITVDEVDYDYRALADGRILILCRAEGPDPSSLFGAPLAAEEAGTTALDLPDSPWWAVVYTGDDDLLHFLYPGGEFATLPRPQLPADPAGPLLQLSPDGRYLLVMEWGERPAVAPVVGAYALETGEFTALFEGQPGEVLEVGSQQAFDRDAGRYAFSLWDMQAQPPTWRVVLLELATGEVLAQLLSSGPEMAAFSAAEQLRDRPLTPAVRYYSEANGEDMLIVQFLVATAGPYPELPALTWYPGREEVLANGYNYPGIAFLHPSGTALVTYTVPDAPAAPRSMGVEDNAVGTLLDDAPGTAPTPLVQSEGEASFFSPAWGQDGDLLLYQSSGPEQAARWNVLRPGSGPPVPLDPDLIHLLGTPAGFLAENQANSSFFSFTVGEGGGLSLNLLATYETGELVWATPPGRDNALERLAGAASVSEDEGFRGAILCEGSPPSQLPSDAENVRARVSFTDGTPLRLWDEPGGRQLGLLEEGTEFSVIGGPQCERGFTWWQIELDDGTVGYVAEGDAAAYFIEPAEEASGG